MEQHVQLARSLPPRLLHFFKRFPPPQLASAPSSISSQQPSEPITIAENTSSSDPNAPTITTTIPPPTETITIAENTSSMDPNVGASSTTITSPTISTSHNKNPFLPFKNPRTGAWHGPHYSLRRQADLFKLAAQHHVLPLMPLSPKHPEVREQKRIENGLRVQGTGIGKKVKGKMWERTLKGRLEDRRKAMEGMPEMIRHWKERGHGRGWKKWPK